MGHDSDIEVIEISSSPCPSRESSQPRSPNARRVQRRPTRAQRQRSKAQVAPVEVIDITSSDSDESGKPTAGPSRHSRTSARTVGSQPQNRRNATPSGSGIRSPLKRPALTGEAQNSPGLHPVRKLPIFLPVYDSDDDDNDDNAHERERISPHVPGGTQNALTLVPQPQPPILAPIPLPAPAPEPVLMHRNFLAPNGRALSQTPPLPLGDAGIEQPGPMHPVPGADAPVHIPEAAAPVQAPPRTPALESIDTYVARVLEILPDALPDHVYTLVENHIGTSRHAVVETVLHGLFENPNYPRVDKKGKGKRMRDDEGAGGSNERSVKTKIDYASRDRPFTGGGHYVDMALDQLALDFPFVPMKHVRRVFCLNGRLYAPSYLSMAEEQSRPELPYVKKTQRSRIRSKGKAAQDDEFEAEREWLLLQIGDGSIARAQDAKVDDDGECADGIECGCCFSTYRFDKMVQCPEAHLFCITCMKSYAVEKLGKHDPNILCMDQSGCKLPFPDSELQRFLTTKLLSLYERVKLRKDIEAACIEGLEECPFCEYKMVIDNEQERLFACENEDCGAVSCRQCKKLDHLPKSCREAEADMQLDGRHTIEEAMTHALMRNCPKCEKAFIKDDGCNKITCLNCGTISCYVCRKVIKGYEHFHNQNAQGPSKAGKCALWDGPVENRHNKEVREAAEKALEEYKRDNPDVDENQLKVDLPPPSMAPVRMAPAPRIPPVRVPMPMPPRMPPLPGIVPLPPPGGMRAGPVNLPNLPPIPQQNFNFVMNPNPNLNLGLGMNQNQNFNNAHIGQMPFQIPPQIPPQMAPIQAPVPGFQAPAPPLYGQPYQQAMAPYQPARVAPAGRVRRARRNY